MLTWLEAPGSSDNEEGISNGAGQEARPASSPSPGTGPSWCCFELEGTG